MASRSAASPSSGRCAATDQVRHTATTTTADHCLASLWHVPTCTTAVCDCACCVVSVDAAKNESELMQEWFNMVHEKNVLVRYESELMVQ